MNDWAMWSVGVIIDEGEINGVAAVAAGSALLFTQISRDLSTDELST